MIERRVVFSVTICYAGTAWTQRCLNAGGRARELYRFKTIIGLPAIKGPLSSIFSFFAFTANETLVTTAIRSRKKAALYMVFSFVLQRLASASHPENET